jgi:muconolactone delta-isomerase
MRFLVESKLKQAPTDAILSLIPAEIAHGAKLDAQGVRLALYIAGDNSGAWQVFQVDALADVEALISAFPLYPFVASTITPLMEAVM